MLIGIVVILSIVVLAIPQSLVGAREVESMIAGFIVAFYAGYQFGTSLQYYLRCKTNTEFRTIMADKYKEIRAGRESASIASEIYLALYGAFLVVSTLAVDLHVSSLFLLAAFWLDSKALNLYAGMPQQGK